MEGSESQVVAVHIHVYTWGKDRDLTPQEEANKARSSCSYGKHYLITIWDIQFVVLVLLHEQTQDDPPYTKLS